MANSPDPSGGRSQPVAPGSAHSRPWFLYLIECVDGSLYTGIAVDVVARFELHKAGKGARYTRAHPPSRILAIVELADRSEASKVEARVKRLKAAEKRLFAKRLATAPGDLAAALQAVKA